jgi:hypothetical protein
VRPPDGYGAGIVIFSGADEDVLDEQPTGQQYVPTFVDVETSALLWSWVRKAFRSVCEPEIGLPGRVRFSRAQRGDVPEPFLLRPSLRVTRSLCVGNTPPLRAVSVMDEPWSCSGP